MSLILEEIKEEIPQMAKDTAKRVSDFKEFLQKLQKKK